MVCIKVDVYGKVGVYFDGLEENYELIIFECMLIIGCDVYISCEVIIGKWI